MAVTGTAQACQLKPGETKGSPLPVPLKVCLVADGLGADAGTEKLVAALAIAFDPAVIETHVCCLQPSERLSNPPAHVRKVVFPTNRVYSPAGLRQIWSFHQYLKRHQVDAIHAFMNNSAIVGVLASRGTRCRAVITSRLNCGYWYTWKWIRMFQMLNRYSTHILSNSVLAKNVTASVEKIAPDRITVFYPGVDLARFAALARDLTAAAPLGIPPDVPVVGIVANFRPVKDLQLFLRAGAVVSAAVPDAVFLLVGQGSLKPELQRLAEELGIAKRVYFSSPDVPIPYYLARMSVACLSSESEGLPNAIMEYMAAGLPVVATDVGGISELIRDGFNGYLVPSRAPKDFAEPIIRLLLKRDLRTTLGRQGLERARMEFDICAAVKRLQQFYIDAVESVPGRATITRP